LGYNAAPPPYTGNFMPPKPNLLFTGLEEFVNEPIVIKPTVKKLVVETSEAKASTDKPKVMDVSKMDKNDAKRTKPSTRLEEYKKSKLKAYTSLNGPTRTHLMGRVIPLRLIL
ncbi:hypothetical protein Tco_1306549, partial [Tanacetum coccineum]